MLVKLLYPIVVALLFCCCSGTENADGAIIANVEPVTELRLKAVEQIGNGSNEELRPNPQADAPIHPSDITFYNIKMTSSSRGYVYVGDTFGCRASCSPAAYAYQWTDLGSGQIFNSYELRALRASVTNMRCTAWNRINFVSYYAYVPITLTICDVGRTCGACANYQGLLSVLLVPLFSKLFFQWNSTLICRSCWTVSSLYKTRKR